MSQEGEEESGLSRSSFRCWGRGQRENDILIRDRDVRPVIFTEGLLYLPVFRVICI